MLEPDFEIYYYEDTSQDFHYANVNPHTHNYYEFYIFLEGHISMDIEGVSHPLVARRCIDHSTQHKALRKAFRQ